MTQITDCLLTKLKATNCISQCLLHKVTGQATCKALYECMSIMHAYRRQLSCASVNIEMTTTWSDIRWWTRTESDRLWFCTVYVSSGMELGFPTMRRSKIMKMVKNPTYKPT